MGVSDIDTAAVTELVFISFKGTVSPQINTQNNLKSENSKIY